MEQQILSVIVQFAACTFLLFAVLLWLRSNGSRSRIYFAVTYLVCGIDLSTRIFHFYSSTPVTYQALHPLNLYIALIEVPLFLFYLVEVVNPGWLTRRKIGLLYLPWGVWNIILLIPGVYFRRLDNFGDILRHIDEPDVWLRLLFVLLILPFNILIYRVPYNWRRSSADRRMIRTYGGGFIVMAMLYICSTASGSILVSSLHLLYCIVFCFYTVYYELFLRLNVPPNNSDIQLTHEASATQENTAGQALHLPGKNETLWKLLCAYMQEEEPWRNPDLTIVSLAEYLNTNRTTLSAEIHTHGYTHLSDFISAYRIYALCNTLDRREVGSMDDAFFEVGYRSRSAAFDSFKKHTGCTPGQYLKMNPEEKKSIKQKMK